MAEENIILIVRIRAREGMTDKVKQELISLATQTHRETGNVYYDLCQATEDKSLFIICEKWLNQKALDEHMVTSYLKNFLAKQDELLTEPIEGTQVDIIS